MKITDDQGHALPWDGKTFGRLKVRGQAVAKSYFKGEGAEVFEADGWFDTGDVAIMDTGFCTLPNGDGRAGSFWMTASSILTMNGNRTRSSFIMCVVSSCTKP